jgi:hypothetical protein
VTTLFKKERAVFLINRVGLTGYLHAKEWSWPLLPLYIKN